MRHKKNLSSLLLTALFILGVNFFISFPVFAQETDEPKDELVTIQGTISEVDAENHKVTINWLYDEEAHKYEDLTLAVSAKASLTKETESIELDDLEQGDEVTVRYEPDAKPLPEVVSITVSET